MAAGVPRSWGRHQAALEENQQPEPEPDRSVAVPAGTTCRPTPATNRRPAKRRSLLPPDQPCAEASSPWFTDTDTCPSELPYSSDWADILGPSDVTLAAPQPHPLTGHLVDPAAVHPWDPELERARSGDQRACLGVPISDRQATPVLSDLAGEARQAGVDLGFQGCGQHAACSLGHDHIEAARQLRARGLINTYSQHRRSFLAGVSPPASP